MNTYKQEFDQKRGNILLLLNEAKDFYSSKDKKEEAETFQSIADQLKAGEFSIVVVGEFSAGKSTFLNALMGKRVLPSFTSETTATVNFLKSKDKAPDGEAGIVYYANGQTQSLEKADFETIQKYVSTRSEIQVAQDVEHLDLFLDSKFLEEGVMLVDSPGLNGTKAHHKEITERQIERSSASIFMFRANAPGSKSDFEFLRELKQKVNTIIFVLNRIDEIRPSEGETVEDVVEKLRESYKEQFPEDTVMPEIWPIAAYPALVARSKQSMEYLGIINPTEEQKKKWLSESRFGAFEDRLWRFLTNGEKAHQMLLEPVNRALNLLSMERNRIKEEKNVLEKKDDGGEIREQIIALEAEEKNIEIKIKGLRSEINQSIAEIMRDEKESVVAKIEAFRGRKQRQIEDWETVNDYDEYMDGFNQEVEHYFKRIARDINEDMNDRIREEVSTKFNEIVEEINQVFDKSEISVQISQTYEVKESSFANAVKKYDDDILQQKNQMREIQEELDKLELSKIEARKLERDRNKVEERIAILEAEKKMYEETFVPPTRCHWTEEEWQEEYRGGVLGIIANVLVGKKQKRLEVTKDNQKEIDEYRKERDRALAEKERKIKEVEAQFQAMAADKQSPEQVDYRINQKNRKLKEAEAEFDAIQKRFKEDFLKSQKSFVTKRKHEVSEYLSDVSDEIADELKKQMRGKGDLLVGAICSELSNGLKSELELKRKQRQSWENKLESSENDRNALIARLSQDAEILDGILDRALSIKAEVEVEEQDTVKQII